MPAQKTASLVTSNAVVPSSTGAASRRSWLFIRRGPGAAGFFRAMNRRCHSGAAYAQWHKDTAGLMVSLCHTCSRPSSAASNASRAATPARSASSSSAVACGEKVPYYMCSLTQIPIQTSI